MLARWGAPPISRERASHKRIERATAQGRRCQRPRSRNAPKPAHLHEMAEHRDGKRSREMIAPLRPVEARIDDATATARHGVGVHTERAQCDAAVIGQAKRAIVEGERALLEQAVVQRDAEPSREMAIAASLFAKQPTIT